ncbi:MAG: hypothetical protein ACRD3B_15520, partial [Candidatus Sulfotelmatobacter sp.]
MRKLSAALSVLSAIVFSAAVALGQDAATTIHPVTVKVTPDTATVESAGTVQFTALIRNTPNAAVTWSASAGQISSTGVFHGPKVGQDMLVTVTATSKADRTKADSASITVKPRETSTAHVEAVSPPDSTATTKGIQLSFFGADFNGAGTWPPTDDQKQVASLGSIRLWDDNVKWGQIETAAGVYNWSKLDSWISKAQAQKMDVLYSIGDTPKWAGSIPKGSPCGPAGSY